MSHDIIGENYMKNKLYILYARWYPDIDRGSEKFPISFCICESIEKATEMFIKMGFREFLENELNKNQIEEINSFDEDGKMYKVPEYLFPY